MLVIKNTFACVCPPRMCVCVDSGNFVVIILGYTANAGARRVPTVCHCIDDELTWEWEGRGKREAWLRASFFGSHCMVLDLVFIQTE